VQSRAYGGEGGHRKDWSIPENPRPQEESTFAAGLGFWSFQVAGGCDPRPYL